MHDPRQQRRAFLRLLRELGYGLRLRHSGWCEVLVWRAEERWLGEGPDRRSAIAAVIARMFPSAAARAALQEPRTEAPRVEEPHVVAPAPLAPPAQVVEVLWQPAPAAPRLSLAELELLHEELNEVFSTLEALFVDVLEWAPERQRLVILAWVARARSIQTRARHEPSIESRVTSFCSRLGTLTKLGWPGNVSALALHALPDECRRELGAQAELPDWAAVADAAEERLAALDTPEVDEQGWADEDFLLPPPPDPRTLLGDVRAQLESWSGPIPDAQSVRDGQPFGGEPSASLAQALRGEARLAILQAARRLRWLRGSDLRGWGECFGRLRWIVNRGRIELGPELESALDARFKPRQSWARECGYDPEARARKQKKNELWQRLRSLVPGDRGALAAWLCESFALGPEMSNDKLAVALGDRKADVLALAAETLGERAQRNRLRKLQELLRGGVPAGAAIALEPEEPVEPRVEPEAPREETPAAVLAFTRGKHVLIVGNRADPALDAALVAQFGFASLDRCDLSPNRIESHCERIQAGSYELVLATTGFMPHKTDGALRKACLGAGVRFVRVNKGRPSACARHLARELGIQSRTPAILS